MEIKIKVLGTGCPTCQRLYNDVKDIVSELKFDAEVEKIEDLQKIMSYGVMSVPALVINDNIKFAGKSPNKDELKKYITGDSKPDVKCSCDHNCKC